MVTPWNICWNPCRQRQKGWHKEESISQFTLRIDGTTGMTWDQFLLGKSDLMGLLMFKRCASKADTMQKATFPVPQYHYFSVPHAGTLGGKILVAKFRGKVLLQFQVAFAKVPPPQPTDLPVKEVGHTWIWRAEGWGWHTLDILPSQASGIFWRHDETTCVRTLCARNMCKKCVKSQFIVTKHIGYDVYL